MSRYQVNQKQPGSNPVRVIFWQLFLPLFDTAEIAITTTVGKTDQSGHNMLGSLTSYTLHPTYETVKALALTSSSLHYAAQRGLYHTITIRSTGILMRFLKSLLLFPANRRYVRAIIATISDHVRTLPHVFVAPSACYLRLDRLGECPSPTPTNVTTDGSFTEREGACVRLAI